MCLPRARIVHDHPMCQPPAPTPHPPHLHPHPLYSTRQVNAAFLPAARVASKAEMVLKRFYERAQGRERATHGAPPSSCVPIAIHWRGQARRRATHTNPNLTLTLP